MSLSFSLLRDFDLKSEGHAGATFNSPLHHLNGLLMLGIWTAATIEGLEEAKRVLSAVELNL